MKAIAAAGETAEAEASDDGGENMQLQERSDGGDRSRWR